jgi:pyridinium-3,5-biscarboxylic acid mononucleotide synthase
MNEKKLREILGQVKRDELAVESAVQSLKQWPIEELGFAKLDHHREFRTGFPEVVYGESKSCEHIVTICQRMIDNSSLTMVTRVSKSKAEKIITEIPCLYYHEQARMLTWQPEKGKDKPGRGKIIVLAAGTSDIPVAEEAYVTAMFLGNQVARFYDVGVAGLHRLLANYEELLTARVIIAVAGMEGALPSVVGGLVGKPIIAVPTSVGYGASFGGVASLLGMLNTCSPGVAVVNIDNGFGAGCMASSINNTGI